jgi:hypothetical protein
MGIHWGSKEYSHLYQVNPWKSRPPGFRLIGADLSLEFKDKTLLVKISSSTRMSLFSPNCTDNPSMLPGWIKVFVMQHMESIA